MISPVRVRHPADRLGHIVQQHGQAQHLLRRSVPRRLQRVHPHAVTVVRIVLRRLHHHVKFREKNGGKPCPEGSEKLFRVICHEKLYQLRLNPLRANFGETCRALFHRRNGRFLHGKPELRGKADSPQHPERIFRKTLPRVSDTADQAALQVPDPAVDIHKPSLIIVRHRVNCKIAPL